jgi:hypothetical protein
MYSIKKKVRRDVDDDDNNNNNNNNVKNCLVVVRFDVFKAVIEEISFFAM